MRSIKETALAFDRACARAGVAYALVGGFAVMAWGQPRATQDVDALVRLEEAQAAAFVRALRGEALTAAEHDLQAGLRDGSHVTFFDARSPYHVDVKLAHTEAEYSQIDAAERVPFENGELRVARPEDTVAYKLKFGSPQDLQDARSILARLGPDLDRARLADLTRRLGVVEALEDLEKELDSD